MDTTYSWGPQTDTVDVCETWVGNDYRWVVNTAGTSERSSGIYDMAHDAAFDGGVFYVVDQGSIIQSHPTGSSIFAAFNADQALIDAAYDDPYYGIAASGWCQENCQSPQSGIAAAPTTADSSMEGFHRHRLSRKGVRALVDKMEEIGASAAGYRRFRQGIGGGEREIMVHPTLQLLMGETFRDQEMEVTALHEWQAVEGGFVRSHTTSEARDRSGRVVHRATMVITNVRLAPR